MLLAALAFAGLVLLARSLGPLVRFLAREHRADVPHATQKPAPRRAGRVHLRVIRGGQIDKGRAA